jgi:hypothetical protein
VHTSVAVNQIKTSVDSHVLLGLDTHKKLQQVGTGVLRVENAVARLTVGRGITHADDTGVCIMDFSAPSWSLSSLQFRTYMKDEIQLIQRVSRHSQHIGSDGTKLTVILHQAERCEDGRVVLVKSYEGSNAVARKRVVRRHLHGWH